MTVGELIAALQDVPPDTLIVMSEDGEGNGFSPLDTVDTGSSAYTAESTWSGEVGLRTLTPELVAEGYSDDDVAGPDAVPCVVLWPTN